MPTENGASSSHDSHYHGRRDEATTAGRAERERMDADTREDTAGASNLRLGDGHASGSGEHRVSGGVREGVVSVGREPSEGSRADLPMDGSPASPLAAPVRVSESLDVSAPEANRIHGAGGRATRRAAGQTESRSALSRQPESLGAVSPDSNICAKDASLRLAYADPPYPGMAGLYPENTEVDHVELVTRLCEYDGWALSTDERSLAYVLPLCPVGTRVLAWCRSNAPFFIPNPAASWEPVLLSPARKRPVTVRSYMVCGVNTLHRDDGLTGQKPTAFCEWIIRCLGALPGDTLDDLFPGTGAMGSAWARFQAQPPLFYDNSTRTAEARSNLLRRTHTPLDGIGHADHHTERATKVRRSA